MPSHRILVVEDQELVREVLVDMLEQQGFEVDHAADGKEAFDLIDADGYELILTDLNLPGKTNGIDVAEHAREKENGVPVLIVSGRPDLAQRAMSLGLASAIVAKPYSGPALISAVRSLIGGTEAQRQTQPRA